MPFTSKLFFTNDNPNGITLLAGSGIIITQSGSEVTISIGNGAVSPGGEQFSIQTNNGSGAFYGDANFLYDGTSVTLNVPIITSQTISISDGYGNSIITSNNSITVQGGNNGDYIEVTAGVVLNDATNGTGVGASGQVWTSNGSLGSWITPAGGASTTQFVDVTQLGQNIVCNSGSQNLYLICSFTGVGTVNSITLPLTPVDGQTVYVAATLVHAFTALTVFYGSAHPVVIVAQTSGAAGTFGIFAYSTSQGKWYQIQ